MWREAKKRSMKKERNCGLFEFPRPLLMWIGGEDMPNIKPISDLRNYTAVINEVTYGNRVYLTRNGHGQCAIIDMKELDELDKMRALNKLMGKLNEAEISIRENGTISADELELELGV